MGIEGAINDAFEELEALSEGERPGWIEHILQRLEAEYGIEALEFIMYVIGSRLKNGKW
jgi:hypothetical protein